ncbi:MAG: helix-turn-helix domain-containing protein [Clostridia bacterium]|nr:helix-turn-helix domain-containing protein [Clostridia bacterium]
MDFSTRLKKLRNQEGITQEQLAKAIGVERSSVGKYETGTMPSLEILSQIASYFNVSVDYLLCRTDDPTNYDDDDLIAEIPESILDHFNGNVRKAYNAWMARSAPGPNNVFPYKTKKIPLLGDIACGEPIFAEEQFGEYVDVDAELNVDFCLRCVGDSMIGARIYDGDIVFCVRQSSVDNGEIAVVIIEDEATLKRVYLENGKLILNPENPAFRPMVYQGEELNQIHILGRAVAFQSRIR